MMNYYNIWLVDDDNFQNRVNTKTIQKSLHDKCNIESFNNPVNAMESLKATKSKPDLIFLDMNMPELNGAAFINKAKSLGLDIPTIILSSSINKEESKALAKEHTFVKKSLSKPLKISDLAFLKSTTL